MSREEIIDTYKESINIGRENTTGSSASDSASPSYWDILRYVGPIGFVLSIIYGSFTNNWILALFGLFLFLAMIYIIQQYLERIIIPSCKKWGNCFRILCDPKTKCIEHICINTKIAVEQLIKPDGTSTLIELDKNIKSMRTDLNTVTNIGILGEFFNLNGIDEVYVVHTHRKKNDPKQCNITDNDKYSQSSIAYDEAFFLYQLVHSILSTPTIKNSDITRCSCRFAWKSIDAQVIESNEYRYLYKKNLIIIGINDASMCIQKALMDLNSGLNYLISDEQGANYIYENNNKNHRNYSSDKLSGIGINETGNCYGLITRVPNPHDEKSTIIMVTGSRREGQFLLTKWIKEYRVEIMNINKEYTNNRPFQIFISGSSNQKGELKDITAKHAPITYIKPVTSVRSN